MCLKSRACELSATTEELNFLVGNAWKEHFSADLTCFADDTCRALQAIGAQAPREKWRGGVPSPINSC